MTSNGSTSYSLNTGKIDWLTPPHIIKSLGEFDLDPCSPINRPWDTAKNHYNINHNGLKQPWLGRVWLNPPYGNQTWEWIKKLQKHENGIGKIYARTETVGFHKFVWNKAHSIFFFKGRIRSYTVDGKLGGSPGAPHCLISYNKYNTESIKSSGLKGKLVIL